MIKKSLIVTICLFIVYNIFLIVSKTNWTPAQYLYQNNIIKADKYLYGNATPKGVIVGTSLSSRIVADSLGVYNLGTPGMAIFNGMEILLKRKYLPKVVFIEINYFYKAPNPEFLKAFNSDEIIFLKSKLPALRDENQPIGISFNVFMNAMGALRSKAPKPLNNPALDTSFFKSFRKDYNHPNVKLINECVFKLKKYIAEITSRGSKVCLFEMPTNPQFMLSPLTSVVRETVRKNFQEYPFIPVQNKSYFTSDGVHLGEKEAMEYTLYLRGQFQALGY